MRKILSIFAILFLFLQNTSFAEFNIETKLSKQKQESLKNQVYIIYKGFEKNIEKLHEQKQISSIEKIIGKIENITKNKLSDKNYFLLSYLNYLLKEKVTLLKEKTSKVQIIENVKVEKETNISNKKIIKSCDSGNHLESDTCINNTKTCSVLNGTGEQIWNGNTWGNCIVKSCNFGYENKNQKCEKIVKTCVGGTHLEADTCVPNGKICSIENGTGEQLWNGNTWGNCTIKVCNFGYENKNQKCEKIVKTCLGGTHLEADTCVSNTKNCTIENGTGEQLWNGNTWWNCVAKSCNSGYENKNQKCEKIVKTCDSGNHLEADTCVNNTKTCTIENGIGEQFWNGNTWGNCIVKSCNKMYNNTLNKCVSVFECTGRWIKPVLGEYSYSSFGYKVTNDGTVYFKTSSPTSPEEILEFPFDIGTTCVMGSNFIRDSMKIFYRESMVSYPFEYYSKYKTQYPDENGYISYFGSSSNHLNDNFSLYYLPYTEYSPYTNKKYYTEIPTEIGPTKKIKKLRLDEYIITGADKNSFRILNIDKSGYSRANNIGKDNSYVYFGRDKYENIDLNTQLFEGWSGGYNTKYVKDANGNLYYKNLKFDINILGDTLYYWHRTDFSSDKTNVYYKNKKINSNIDLATFGVLLLDGELSDFSYDKNGVYYKDQMYYEDQNFIKYKEFILPSPNDQNIPITLKTESTKSSLSKIEFFEVK